jgi:hypothetical protein
MKNMFYYTDTDCMYVRPDHRPMVEGNELGKLKDESLGGSGKIFSAIFLGKKQYAYFVLNKDNEIKLVLRCKGISEPFLLWSDYISASRDRGYSRETRNEFAIKSFGVDKEFFQVRTVSTKRTFNKTNFHSRLPYCLDTLRPSADAVFTLPHGHILDTFKMGEKWWYRATKASKNVPDFDYAAWARETAEREEATISAKKLAREEKLAEEFQAGRADPGKVEDENEWDLTEEIEEEEEEENEEKWEMDDARYYIDDLSEEF